MITWYALQTTGVNQRRVSWANRLVVFLESLCGDSVKTIQKLLNGDLFLDKEVQPSGGKVTQSGDIQTLTQPSLAG